MATSDKPSKSPTRAPLRAVHSPARVVPSENQRGRPKAGVIAVKGAREHNLKNIDIELPRDKLIVITGPAPLCREFERLRPSVLGDDAEARRRPYRRPVACDLD
jgi:hypothetical protein